jgi:hypothetical protein
LPEWLIERGIGETRAVLVESETIIEARVLLEGAARAGSVIEARIVSSGVNVRNAVARDEQGVEYLLPRGAARVPQGASAAIEVTREAIPGGEAWKRPLARLTEKAPKAAPELRGRSLIFPAPSDQLAQLGWNDLLDEARSGIVRFAGGELRISPTPAMTLIDVDGYLEPEQLAEQGAVTAAQAVRRLDIGGSIGIDLPTSGSKAARARAAAAIDANLPQPFERTTVNGFGFVQIVRPRSRPSLIELAQDRAVFEVRALLRQVAMEGPGGRRLIVHPKLFAVLEGKSAWLDTLGQQIGGRIELRAEPAVPISGAYAERL